MKLALAEGRQALPACLPSARRMRVLIRGGQVSHGLLQAPGSAHAEAMCLNQVQGDLSDVCAFVTLEPCSFHGRTPSCAHELVKRKIGRVVVAILDPDPRNAGRALKNSEGAGIAVEVGILEKEAMADLSVYLALPDNFLPDRVADPMREAARKFSGLVADGSGRCRLPV
ncbi:MAG: hypothetical protein R3E83_22060 [Burkholderiaceae bacterium]